MGFSDLFSDFIAAVTFTEAYADAPPNDDDKTEDKAEEEKSDEGEEKEENDDKEGGDDAEEEQAEDEPEEEEEEEEEPVDPKPKLEEGMFLVPPCLFIINTPVLSSGTMNEIY
jgi:ubiquinol-cytochrome c reductase subunit 6